MTPCTLYSIPEYSSTTSLVHLLDVSATSPLFRIAQVILSCARDLGVHETCGVAFVRAAGSAFQPFLQHRAMGMRPL